MLAAFLLVIGAALVAVGADLLVDNGTLIAQALGVPESVIALTFVALGTSLPELVTAITSLAKGHSDLSLGNVVGANVFNLVLVSGVSVTLAPFSIPQNSTIAGMNASLVMDIPVMFAVMLLLKKCCSTVFSGHIWKFPYIAKSDCTAGRNQNKAQSRTEIFSFVHCCFPFYRRPSSSFRRHLLKNTHISIP